MVGIRNNTNTEKEENMNCSEITKNINNKNYRDNRVTSYLTLPA